MSEEPPRAARAKQAALRLFRGTTPSDNPVRAVAIYDDLNFANITLRGSDREKLKRMTELVDGARLERIEVRNLDRIEATAWVDDDGIAKRLPNNALASALLNRSIVGPAVITGPAREGQSITELPGSVFNRLLELQRTSLQAQKLLPETEPPGS